MERVVGPAASFCTMAYHNMTSAQRLSKVLMTLFGLAAAPMLMVACAPDSAKDVAAVDAPPTSSSGSTERLSTSAEVDDATGQTASSAAGELSDVSTRVVNLLPLDVTHADVLGVVPSPRMAELTAMLEAAATADPTEFNKLMAAAPPGEPIPFGPALGLTREEYVEFLAGAADAEPGVVDQVELQATKLTGDRYELSGSASAGGLTGFVFDAGTTAFTTPFGNTGPATPWTNSNTDSFLGAATGWRWEYTDPAMEDDMTSASGAAIKITLAVRAADDRRYLSVVGGRFEEGVPTSAIDIDFFYESSDL